MAFHFTRKATIADDIKRMAAERIEGALQSLQTGIDGSIAVHSIRKDVKKLRAILRLVRHNLDRSAFGQEMATLKSVAQSLAPMRDAQVKLAVFDEVIKLCRNEGFPKKLSRARSALLKERAEAIQNFLSTHSQRTIREVLVAMSERVDDWDLEDDWKSLGPGLRRSYGCGRKGLELVEKEPTAENFHAWRKKAKDLWYHTRLLQPLWPGLMEPMCNEVGRLGEALGKDHDLVVLKSYFDTAVDNSMDPKEIRPITAMVARR